ncbi:DUF4199 family protein [Hymenobacter sp. BRD128]|uniref:DUF4199 domain-containing protein n=1 Tax=Hymenobacter sp. BRD128 TaxID=2675878 RepID=UPI001563C5A5|nr:DUF4199 domain-containing protein [Hymenobacter sp. BRD128]QKG55461.1 DUF4199 family protein [Hymenobacter sp. BRD128]
MQPEDLKGSASVRGAAAPGLVGQLGLRFGVGAGLVCAAWLLFLQWSGNNPFSPKQIMGLLVVPFVAAGSQWFLRYKLAPARPGVGRTLAVGGLTVLLAASMAAASVWALAHTVGEQELARNRSELIEITKVQQRLRPKEKRNAAFEKQELAQAGALSVNDLARGTFTWTILLGLLLAVPSGIFLRK